MPLTSRSAMIYRCSCDVPGCAAVAREIRVVSVFASRQEAVELLEKRGWRQLIRAGRYKAVEQMAMRGDGAWRCPVCVRAGRAKEPPIA